jgi:TonB-linked SusC/RagA family outer membrane protein
MFAQENLPGNINVTIRKGNATVGEILGEIEKQTGYYFVFSKEDLNIDQTLTLQVQNEKLESLLTRFLSVLHVTYIFSGNHIILKRQVPGKEMPPEETLRSEPVEKEVNGIVFDPNGDPVIGAFVFEEGSKSNGTVTDRNGKFRLLLPPAVSVRIHCLGFSNKTVPVVGKTFLHIYLEKEMRSIDEVIVVGYGTRKRLTVTGSIASVTGGRLALSQRPDMSNALAANLPGVRTIQKSGRPGYDGSLIDIRGYGEDILTIVDGVERPFSQIDPNEIESVSILKDASAAIYGYKGANGVLLITTKKGAEAKTRINYNFNYAMQSITRYPEYMNVQDYMSYYNEAWLNLAHSGQNSLYTLNDRMSAVNTDWQDAALKDFAPMQQHNLNITGGNQDTKYFFSLGYLDQDGILKTRDKFRRFNFRSNLSTVISDRMTAEMQLGGRKEIRDAPATVSGSGNGDKFSQGIFKNIAMALPYKPVYANNNPLYYNNLGSEQNPVALLDRNLVGTDLKQYEEFNGQFALNYDLSFCKGLSVNALIAYDKQIAAQSIFKKASDEYTYYPIEDAYVSFPLIRTTERTETLKQNNIINQQYSIRYKNGFGKHDLSGLLLWEIRRIKYAETKTYGEFDLSSVSELDAAGASNKNVGGNSYQTANMGFIGRINYMFDDKYMFELSFRDDGVSKFVASNRWTFTAGLSAGWRISEENFIKSRTGIFENLKIRASFGMFPLANMLNDTYFLSGYNYPGRDIFGAPLYFVQGEDNSVLTASNRGIINPYLTWEKVSTTNIGLDASLWGEKLYVEWDWFFRMHTGIYFSRNQILPTTFGAKMPDENLNSESDRGTELVLGSKQKLNEWNFDTKFIFSYARKKREYQELPEAGNRYAYWENRYLENNGRVSKNPYRWDNITWGSQALGQFQNFREILQSPIQDGQGNTTLLPGDIKYRDFNDDGLINNLDLVPIGRNDWPEIFFGVNFSMMWKNLDLTVFFQGATNYTYTFNYKEPFVQGGIGNAYEMYKDRWHRADVNDPYSEWIPGYFPPLRVEGYEGNLHTSTFWSKNTSYLRLKTIDCGYSFPRKVCSKLGIHKLRIYINAYNLLTFSSKELRYVDPEGETDNGIYYPQMKTVNFGLNIEF